MKLTKAREILRNLPDSGKTSWQSHGILYKLFKIHMTELQ